MSFFDFAIRLKLAIEEIEETREQESILIGRELTALVRNRVQNDKVNAFGVDFTPYTPAWAMIREDNNLQSEQKDFTFTGVLWKNIGVTDVNSSSGETTISIGGQTSREVDILEGQSTRDGNIIEPNEQEVQFVVEAHEERIFGILQRFFG